jgi:hypothetical protein
MDLERVQGRGKNIVTKNKMARPRVIQTGVGARRRQAEKALEQVDGENDAAL